MLFAPVNLLAVLVAAIVNMVLGTLWFGPVFGEVWMKAGGIKKPEVITPEMKKQMGKSYSLMFVGNLVTAFIFSNILTFAGAYLHVNGAYSGFMGAIFIWLGFIAPVTMGVVLWDRKTWKYWAITYLYYLVALIVMGVILASWM